MKDNILTPLHNGLTIEHENFQLAAEKILSEIQHGIPDQAACLIGPGGIGKSTLARFIANQLAEQQQNGWRGDSAPPLLIEAAAQYGGDFPWRSFIEDLLLQLGEADINAKVDLDKIEDGLRSGERSRSYKRLNIGQLESLLRKRIKALRPSAILIDECQNLVEDLSLSKRRVNVNRLKNWANTMDTRFVLFGTHKAKELLNLNEQLARRIQPIYFPRYRNSDKHERKDFRDFYKGLVKLLGVNCDEAWLNDFPYIYSNSLGCPGVFVSWFSLAVRHCISKNITTLTKKIMHQNRLPYQTLAAIELAIKEFEEYYEFTFTEFDPNLVHPEPYQHDMDYTQIQAPNTSRRTSNLKPGQQKPKRHPVMENQYE